MKFPNYEPEIESNKYHQLYPFMPSSTFRMLICGPSGCGKTNSLMHMIYQLLYFDKINYIQRIWKNQNIKNY